MLVEFFSSLDYQVVIKALLVLLVFYVLVILYAKKYLKIINKIILAVVLMFLFILYIEILIGFFYGLVDFFKDFGRQ